MGRDSHFVCKDCKKHYYLGYGCYSTWWDRVENVQEYDGKPDEHKNLNKNKNLRHCLDKHEGHDFFTYSEDWMHETGGHLYREGQHDDECEIEDFDDYEYIDLWEDQQE